MNINIRVINLLIKQLIIFVLIYFIIIKYCMSLQNEDWEFGPF